MPRFKDLSGQRFGKLLVLRRDPDSPPGRVKWICKCDCGNTVSLWRANLTNPNRTMSCGCVRKKTNKVQDLSGQRFGKLTVLHRDLDAPPGRSKWVCRCECGEIVSVLRNHLVSGSTKACGGSCARTGTRSSCARKKVNFKDIAGQRFGRLVALEATDEKEKSGESYIWKCQCDCGNICYTSGSRLRAGITRSCGCLVSEHGQEIIKKALAESKKYQISDTDVRALLPDRTQSNNTSGKRGVFWDSSVKVWKATIEFRKHRYYLGSSRDFETAVQYREEAEKRIHGEFLDWYAETYPKEWAKLQSRNKEK